MTFVTVGLALAGLAAAAIPIIIHLLARQRRKPIEWAAMRFLLEAYRRHRRRLQLEQILLLAVRCLVLVLLGLALARPLLESGGLMDLGGGRSVYLVLDNGMTSGVEVDGQVTALDRLVDQAVETIESLGPGDLVGLVTAARPVRGLVVPPSSDHGAVIDLLRQLKPASAPSDLSSALELLETALSEVETAPESTLVYLLSEFRAGSAPLDRTLPSVQGPRPGRLTLLATTPSAQTIGNTQIVSIDPVRSLIVAGATDGSGQVVVRLERHGGELDADVSRVTISGEDLPPVAPKEVAWQPGQSRANVEFSLEIPVQGDRQVALTATVDDDRLRPDNQRFAVLESRDHIRVLLVARRSFGFEPSVDRLSPGQWIRRALEPIEESPMRIIEVEPAALEPTDLRNSDVAIVPRPDLLREAGWGYLRRFVDAGGLLLVMPPAEQQVHQWVEQLPETMGLPWRLELEVTDHNPGLPLAEAESGGELLQMISSELGELTMPVLATRVLAVDDAQTQASRVLRFADGSSAVIAGSPTPAEPATETSSPPAVSEGLVVYLAVPPSLSWTNLPSKPLMVPLYHEIIRQGLSAVRSSRICSVGASSVPGIPAAARTLVGPDETTLAVEAGGRLSAGPGLAGLYVVKDPAGQPLGQLAVNVDAEAGRTEVQEEPAVKAWLAESGSWVLLPPDELAGRLERVRSGAPLARMLLVALLVLVIVETLLARWFSHALRRGSRVETTIESRPMVLGGLR